MTPSSPARRVLVIGAGAIGTSTALQLARSGASVTLITESIGSAGASGRSLSWLNSAGPRSDDYHRLRMAGIERYRSLATRLGAPSFLHFDGGLTWAGPDESFRDRHRHETDIGYESLWVSPAEAARWVPGIDPDAVAAEGAIFNPGEGWVDLPMLADELLTELVEAGATVRTGIGRATVRVTDGRATGATTESGETFDADAVVLATGPWVPRDLAELGVVLPELTPVSLLVTSKPVDSPLRAVLNTPRVAVRPTPDGALVFDAGWSEEEVVVREDGTYAVADSTVARLVEEARAVLAGHPELEVERYGVGPKPIPGDGEPVAGPVEEVPGLFAVFTHSGATLALILGELVAREVLTGEESPLLRSFRPRRFAAADR